jgi:hypothetical protein
VKNSDLSSFENELVLVTMANGERHGGRFIALPNDRGFRIDPDYNWPGSESIDSVSADVIREVALQR